MTYKIAFFDLDETLLNSDKQILDSSFEAISQLRNKGILPVIATGRAFYLSTQFANQLDIHTMINSNGAYVIHKEEVIYKSTIPRTYLHAFHTLSQQLSVPVIYSSVKNSYRNQFDEVGLRNNFGVHDMPLPPEDIFVWLSKDIYSLFLFGDEKIEKQFQHEFPYFDFKRWNDQSVDVLLKSNSKAVGISLLLKELNIKPEEAIAFGDGLNDIEMLSYVGLGIAMGNGFEETKKSAKFVTKTNDDNGIYHALKHFNII